jgi:hypothetical protein
LIDNQTEYLKNDPNDVFQIIFRYEGCENLRKFCLDTICKDPKILFESPKFTSLEKDIIILFLKKIASDELNLQKLRNYICQAEYLKNDPVDVLQIVFRCEGCEDFRKFYLDTICENPKILFESPKFTSLEKDFIILFLKKNELKWKKLKFGNSYLNGLLKECQLNIIFIIYLNGHQVILKNWKKFYMI